MFDVRHLPGQHDQQSHAGGDGDSSGLKTVAGGLIKQASYSSSEKDALNEYQNGDWVSVNEALRKGDTSHPLVKLLDAAIAKGELLKDATLYRGYAFDEAPPLGQGRLIIDPGYTSTSLSREVAEDFSIVAGAKFAVTLALKAAKGLAAAYFPKFQDYEHHEVLLPRGLAYRITDVSGPDNNIKMNAVIVPKEQVLRSTYNFLFLRDFDPNQPRDEDGKWAGGGGGGSRWGRLKGKGGTVESKHADLFGQSYNPGQYNPAREKKIALAIDAYTGEVADFVNAALRGKLIKEDFEDDDFVDEGKDTIKGLDLAFAAAKLAKNLIVYRDFGHKTAERVKANVGGEFTDHGFVSTASDKNAFTVGGQKFPIVIRAGAKALPIAHMADDPTEHEVLIDRGSKFKIKQTSKGRVYLELIGQVAKIAAETALKAKRDFDPNQPRDEDGKWSGGGGGGFAGGKASGSWKSLKGKKSSEAVEKHDTMWKASGGSKIKTPQVAALRDYTFPGFYSPLNKFLRTGKFPAKVDQHTATDLIDTINRMDLAFNAAKLAKNTLTYRAVKPNVFDQIVKQVGGEFVDKGFVSTTADKGYAKLFAQTTLSTAADTILPVVIRAGAKALPLAAIADDPGEQEVLLDRGARFQVKQSKKGRVYLELLGHVAKAAAAVAVAAGSRHLPGEHDQQSHAGDHGGGGKPGIIKGLWTPPSIKSTYKDLVAKTNPTSFEPHEQEAIQAYLDYDEFDDIQKRLRKGVPWTRLLPHERELVSNFSDAIQSSNLAENAKLYRGIAESEDNFGENLGKKFLVQLGKLAIGAVFKDPGFMSTSFYKGPATDFADFGGDSALLNIHAFKGDKAIGLPTGDWSEFVFDRDQPMKYLGRENNEFHFETLNALRSYQFRHLPGEHDQMTHGHGGEGESHGSGGKNLKSADTDRAQWPAHIKALKLPPAWTSVKYSEDPKSPLQATGRDAKGRTQYVYSEAFQKTQQGIKFERVSELIQKMNVLKAQNADNMRSDNAVTREHAEVMALVMDLGLRPGSSQDTKAATQAYGATTLLGQHVVEVAGKVALQFTGKKGVSLNLPVEDSKLASMLLSRAKSAGEGGKLFPKVNERSLLDYSSSLGEGGFKTKDFRTALATSMATHLVSTMSRPENVQRFKKLALEVAKVVSKKLGNTPTVALQSYIHPTVFAPWREHAGS
jgi:DNA topoisomerase I